MPEGYKNFSKTKPMKLEHFAPAIEWWDNREEILPPKELIQQYQEKRTSLNADIDRILAQITDILGIDITEAENCQYLDRQYMFGDNLLVAPIFNEDGKGRFYLPEGTWTDYLTNETYVGGRWYTKICDF